MPNSGVGDRGSLDERRKRMQQDADERIRNVQDRLSKRLEEADDRLRERLGESGRGGRAEPGPSGQASPAAPVSARPAGSDGRLKWMAIGAVLAVCAGAVLAAWALGAISSINALLPWASSDDAGPQARPPQADTGAAVAGREDTPAQLPAGRIERELALLERAGSAGRAGDAPRTMAASAAAISPRPRVQYAAVTFGPQGARYATRSAPSPRTAAQQAALARTQAAHAALQTDVWREATVGASSRATPRARSVTRGRRFAQAAATGDEAPPEDFDAIVSADGEGDYATIGEAIEGEDAGARIGIRPGSYPECIVLTKTVTLVGDGPRDDIRIEPEEDHCLDMQTAEATVKGITLHAHHGVTENEGKKNAVLVSTGKLTLEQCVVQCDSFDGVVITGASTEAILHGCLVQQCFLNGVWLGDGARATLDECDILESGVAGLAATAAAEPALTNCTIHGCKKTGVFVYAGGRGAMETCEVYENGGDGVVVEGAESALELNGCDLHANEGSGLTTGDSAQSTATSCSVRDNKQGGAFFYLKATAVLEDCQIGGGKYPSVAIRGESDPVIRNCDIADSLDCGVYVWDKGKGTIEDCEIHANAGNGVVAASGGAPVVRGCAIHTNGGTGAFVNSEAAPEFADCDIHKNGECGVFFTENAKGHVRTCEIRGNGVKSDEKSTYAAVGIRSGASPVLGFCRIYDNAATGVSVWDGGQGLLEECEIHDNGADGIMISTEGDPTFRDCRIHDVAEAGVFVWDGGHGTFEDCDIYGTEYPGLLVQSGGNPVVRDCRIHDGDGNGVLIMDSGLGRVENCEISGFPDQYPALVISSNGDPTVSGCTISRNRGFGVYAVKHAKGTVKGCDLRGNQGGPVYADDTAQTIFEDNQM